MKQTRLMTRAAAAVLLCALLPGAAGCDPELAGEVATVSAAYLGELVTVLTSGLLHEALGLEDSASSTDHAHEDEHTHDAAPLHDHEH